MATIRPGQRSALLVVDVQVGVMARAWDARRVVDNVALAVNHARAQQVPVIWVQHADAEHLPAGSAAWQWVPELQPQAGELHIDKQHNSAFEDTPLDAELARLGITQLVLAGAATNFCIRATAYAALERGYDLLLVQDAHSTEDLALDDGSRIDAATVVRDLNTTLRWLSYPGRRNRVAPVAGLSFDAA